MNFERMMIAHNNGNEFSFDLLPDESECGNNSGDDAAASYESDKKLRKNNHENRSTTNHRNVDNNNRSEGGANQLGNNNQYRNSRQSVMDLEEQFETSKLVLQLVTDSRFNMTQINGQRKLGGPPPGWKGPPPGPGCEIFVGKIPRTLYEHEIYPIFRRMGEVYEIRLMMDFSGTNRGYCFVMFGRPEFAQRAIRELNDFEIRPGRRIGVVASINNCRLYVGQLPPDISSETVIKKIYDITDDVGQVSVYRNANGQARYALISYKTHRGAAMARRRLVPERASLFDGAEVSIDWAHPGMFPSNVVEESGTADEHGDIEMFRMIVGNENRRYQTRRRARDEFLDSSIKSYIESDRALGSNSAAPRGRQHALHQRGLDCCLNGFDGTTMTTTTTTSFDSKSTSSLSSVARSSLDSTVKGYSKKYGEEFGSTSTPPDMTTRSSNSFHFDLTTKNQDRNRHRGSCSSESSIGSSRSDHGIVNTAMNNLFSVSPDRHGGGSENAENRYGDYGETKATCDSFNLFESYTFFTPANISPDNSPGSSDRSGNGSAKNYFSANISTGIENEQDEGNESPLEESLNFDSEFLKSNRGNEKNLTVFTGGGVVVASPKDEPPSSSSDFINPMKKSSASDRASADVLFGGVKTGPPKNCDNVRNNPSLPLCRSRDNGNLQEVLNRGWQPAIGDFENARSPIAQLQSRNGNFSSLAFSKNSKNAKSGAALNPRNFTQRNGYYNVANNLNVNANARRAWLSAQMSLNGRDFPPDNVAGPPNFSNVTPDFLSSGLIPAFRSQTLFLTAGYQSPNVYPNGFATAAGQNSVDNGQGARVRNISGDYQNRRFSAGVKNGQKIGRPILSRSHASFCNEN